MDNDDQSCMLRMVKSIITYNSNNTSLKLKVVHNILSYGLDLFHYGPSLILMGVGNEIMVTSVPYPVTHSHHGQRKLLRALYTF